MRTIVYEPCRHIGWIEFLFDGRNAGVFAAAIEDTSELLVPVICLYEVFKKVNAVADEARALQAVAQMKQGMWLTSRKILPSVPH
jgi:hypothetical protein